jgi:L-iditol 2-dehydrogenase
LKALVKFDEGKGNLEVREVDIPKIESDEVLLKVKGAAICGTDLHIYEGHWPVKPPVIIGHEFSGEIVEIGENIEDWYVGDRVVSETHADYCGVCFYCKTGNPNLCNARKGLGQLINGAFAEYVAVKGRTLHKIPQTLSYKEAAIIEPVADVIHAINDNSNISMGDLVAILGPGPIGLISTQLVKLAGAYPVIVTGISADEYRLEVASDVGADFIVNVQKESLENLIYELTNGLGVDVILEASGANPAIEQAFSIVRKKGQITLIGIPTGLTGLDFREIILKEISVKGTFVNIWKNWEKAIKLISNKQFNANKLITHTFKLEEWEKAFNLLIEKKAIKIVFLF